MTLPYNWYMPDPTPLIPPVPDPQREEIRRELLLEMAPPRSNLKVWAHTFLVSALSGGAMALFMAVAGGEADPNKLRTAMLGGAAMAAYTFLKKSPLQ